MRYPYKLILTLLSFLLLSNAHDILAQSSKTYKPMIMTDVPPIIDYITNENRFGRVPLPEEIRLRMASRTTAPTAVFEVTYIGFAPGEQSAFQFAVDIWSTLLSSPVPIRLTVELTDGLGQGVLAATGWGSLQANFPNAQKINTWYVVATAEKMAGEDLNDPSSPDIVMAMNSEIDWFLGTTGITPPGTHDLVSVALHEIGHGLGFFSHTFVQSGIGSYGNNVSGVPIVYSRELETGIGQNIVDDFTSGSANLGAALTSDSIFFNSYSFQGGTLPHIYAPANWNSGSSIAHLDESTYPANNTNSLMTPQIGAAESIHDPGLALEMLEDIGWIAMDIDHLRTKDKEDTLSAIPITAVVQGDNPIATNGVSLHYTFSNFANEQIVEMLPTANPDEFSVDIPAPATSSIISYFISVVDSVGREFTNPGEASTFFHQFVVAPDTVPPLISHEPLSIVFINDLIANIEATVFDNIGVTDLVMTYRVNSGTTATLIIPQITVDNDGIFTGTYKLGWDLAVLGVVKGDTVEYRLDVSDVAAVPNSAVHPGIGFNQILVDAINPAVVKYENDFNVPTSDFIGTGFRIALETGFDSEAIMSDHPYRSVDGVSPDDTLVLDYILKTPIILSSSNATIRFDEVLLVEPGETGSVFGDIDFWDYVIVQGSKDLGVTWQQFEVGYDSRDNIEWFDRWNSAIVGQNSAATGDSDLFKPRIVDMIASNSFLSGDTVLIRFKLLADQLAVGWGWAIDNIKIQIDDIAPEIVHIPLDMLSIGQTTVDLTAKVTDNLSVDSVTFEVNLNGQTSFFPLQGPGGIYKLNLGISPVTANDIFKYRIIAVDSSDIPNTSFSPVTGFYEIPVAVLGAVKSSYISDFNTPSDDFIGFNFNISQEPGFDDPAINSMHFYTDAPDTVRTISYLLKFPIKLNSSSAWISYDEIALVEPVQDLVVLELSVDGGITWIPAIDPYSATASGSWNSAFNQKDNDGNSISPGELIMLKHRFFNALDAPGINGGEEALVRFSMNISTSVHGWGWFIDNLEIQGPTTAVDVVQKSDLAIFPNPIENGLLHIRGKGTGNTNTRLEIINLMGKTVFADNLPLTSNNVDVTLNIPNLNKGIYIVRIVEQTQVFTSRIMVK